MSPYLDIKTSFTSSTQGIELIILTLLSLYFKKDCFGLLKVEYKKKPF
jgi:hypothetical protein